MQEFLQYVFSGITNGAIYTVIAIGFSMLYNSTDLINFAHGEFVMFGALGLVLCLNFLKINLFFSIFLTVFIVILIGLLFERLAISSVSKPEPIVLVIITVGASIFLRGLAMVICGKDSYSIASFFTFANSKSLEVSNKPIDILGAKLLPQSIWILFICLLIITCLHIFYKKTLTGKAMQASAINKKAAWIVGIPTKTMILLAFMMSAGLGGIAGVIISPITMISYDMGIMLGLKGFCAAMLGGLGSLWGALIGGFLLGLLESLGAGYLMSSLKDASAFVLLLLILYLRPGGIIGAKQAKRF